MILVSTLRGTLDNMSMINATVFCVLTRRTDFRGKLLWWSHQRLYFSSIFNGELKDQFDDLRSYQAQYHKASHKEMAIIYHLILYTIQLHLISIGHHYRIVLPDRKHCHL